MKIFTHEFKTSVKKTLFCRWRKCKPGRWTTKYLGRNNEFLTGHSWRPRRYCKRCGSRLSTWEEEQKFLNKNVIRAKTLIGNTLSKKEKKRLKKTAKKGK